MAAELAFDVVEEILKRLDVKDLLRCQSVCKSWHSLISSLTFVKSHLNYSCNNNKLGYRRIVMHRSEYMDENSLFNCNLCHLIGSSNGLVCVSPKYGQLLVTNPSTREVKKLQELPDLDKRWSYWCFGFGYDSSTDDYKVIRGFWKRKRTQFYVLTLKSNIWKFIGEVKYKTISNSRTGILCNGSLHWFMKDENNKKVIISFDLSGENFEEIPQPDDLLFKYDEHDKLGVIEQCLCVYRCHSPFPKDRVTKWVMKNYNVWELFPYDCEMEYGDARYLRELEYVSDESCSLSRDGIYLFVNAGYICAPVFVQSLVSPHSSSSIDKKRNIKHTKNSKRNRKLI